MKYISGSKSLPVKILSEQYHIEMGVPDFAKNNPSLHVQLTELANMY